MLMDQSFAAIAATLDQAELTLAAHYYVSGRTLASAHLALGWTPQKVERVKKRLARKMTRLSAELKPPPRHCLDTESQNSMPQFQERLASGHRVWTMRRVRESYRRRIVAGMPFIDASDCRETIVSPAYKRMRGLFMKQLEAAVTAAQQNLSRIRSERTRNEQEISALETKLAAAVVKGDPATAILKGEKPQAKSPEVAELERKIDSARSMEAHYHRACQRAGDEVEEAKGRLEANLTLLQGQKLEPEVGNWFTAVEAVVRAHAALGKKIESVGPLDLTAIMFPAKNLGAMDYQDACERGALIGIYNAFAELARTSRGHYDRVAERQEVA